MRSLYCIFLFAYYLFSYTNYETTLSENNFLEWIRCQNHYNIFLGIKAMVFTHKTYHVTV